MCTAQIRNIAAAKRRRRRRPPIHSTMHRRCVALLIRTATHSIYPNPIQSNPQYKLSKQAGNNAWLGLERQRNKIGQTKSQTQTRIYVLGYMYCRKVELNSPVLGTRRACNLATATAPQPGIQGQKLQRAHLPI